MNAMMQKPILRVIDGRVTTISMVVAEHFGKQHRDVLRAIRNLGCSAAFAERNFAQCRPINGLAVLPSRRETRAKRSVTARNTKETEA